MASKRRIWLGSLAAGFGGAALLAGLAFRVWPRLEIAAPHIEGHRAQFVVRNGGLLPVTDLDISCENAATRWDVSTTNPLFPPLLPLSHTRLDAAQGAVLTCAMNAEDFPMEVHAGYRVLGLDRRAHFRVEQLAGADETNRYRMLRVSGLR